MHNIFRLEESGVLTDCSIRTQESEDTLDFNFSSTNVINKIIMRVNLIVCDHFNILLCSDQNILCNFSIFGWLNKYQNIVCFHVSIFYIQSECLKEAFSDLDMTSEVLQIIMSPEKPYLRLSTFGNAGSIHVSIA